jgi:hypothetical protein
MKASEMFCFVRNFALMVGDLVPTGDEVWSFYLCLQDILDLVFAKRISTKELILLKTLISEHHEEYLHLFNDTLKPKHHFMLHYVRSIEFLGPLRLIWSMRFEAKHGQSKKTANFICNFKNICKSLAHKHHMKLCYRLQARSGLSQGDLEVGTGNVVKLSASFSEELYLLLTKFSPGDQQFIANWVVFNGIKYRPGQALVVGVEHDMPKFGTVYSITVDPSRDVSVVISEMHTVMYDEHYHAFEVVQLNTFSCIKPLNLLDHRPLYVHNLFNAVSHRLLVSLYRSL